MGFEQVYIYFTDSSHETGKALFFILNFDMDVKTAKAVIKRRKGDHLASLPCVFEPEDQ